MSWSPSKYFPSRFIPSWLLTVGAGAVSEIFIDGASDMPAGTYRITATVAATPVDVRIVYRD